MGRRKKKEWKKMKGNGGGVYLELLKKKEANSHERNLTETLKHEHCSYHYRDKFTDLGKGSRG